MTLPWGVNQQIDPDKAQAVITFVASLQDKRITLPSHDVVSILKADVKERKGKYVLIFRYEITQRA